MNREQFDHTIRAAGAILGVDEVLVIGSQAIHASIDISLPEAERSIEVDIAGMRDPSGSKADLIDGSIGELSVFQQTYGYYARGVTPKTAVLPSGWRGRLIPYESTRTNGVRAMCLEPHDLWISKAIAGRTKASEFCSALVRHGIVDPLLLVRRLAKVRNLESIVRERVRTWIDE